MKGVFCVICKMLQSETAIGNSSPCPAEQQVTAKEVKGTHCLDGFGLKYPNSS